MNSILRDILYSPTTIALIVLCAAVVAWRTVTAPGTPISQFSTSFGKGLADHARSHVILYILAFTLAASATADAIAENFSGLTPEEWSKMGWWQIGALVFKSLKPAFVAISALMVKPPLGPEKALPVSNGTNPPIPVP